MTEITPSPKFSLSHLNKTQTKQLATDILSLMDISGVDIGRATHYNSKEEIEAASNTLHSNVFAVDRTIYGCIFCIPGVTDFSKQKALRALFGNPVKSGDATALPIEIENRMMEYMLESLQANRIINLFVSCKENKINNARTRKTILRILLNSKMLEWWSVKYRAKLKSVFEHVLNIRTSGIIKSILSQGAGHKIINKENGILTKNVLKYVNDTKEHFKVLRCVSFILGNTNEISLPLHKAFNDAKGDLSKGKTLPPEVLEGLRATYHKDVKRAEVIKLTKDTSMSNTQKRLIQKSAQKAGVKVKFDPRKQDLVQLFIYGFEMGFDKEIFSAINAKARKIAKTLPFAYERVAIILDDSNSMRGSDESKMKPYAVAHATASMLGFSGKKSKIITASGRPTMTPDKQIVKPKGETMIAEGLVEALKFEPDAAFVITDGYENAPAGRFSEVMKLVRDIGVHIPIYQINPVASSDSGTGMRRISELVPLMPISRPETIGLTIFKSMLEAEPAKGIEALVTSTLPMIEGGE